MTLSLLIINSANYINMSVITLFYSMHNGELQIAQHVICPSAVQLGVAVSYCSPIHNVNHANLMFSQITPKI